MPNFLLIVKLIFFFNIYIYINNINHKLYAKFQKILRPYSSYFLIAWAAKTNINWSRPRIIGFSCIIQLHPSTSSSPSPPTCHETSPLTKYQCYHWRITYSGAARCTLAGLAARTTRSLLLQTCTGWYGGRVERQWPEGGERELRPAAGGGTGIWKGQE